MNSTTGNRLRAALPFRLNINKGKFYRTCRMLHTYLSAAAFIMLMFFSMSGLLLNHPDWFGAGRSDAAPVEIELEPAALAEAVQSDAPGAALAGLVRQETRTAGAFRTADIMEDEAFLRYTGVKGTTDVYIDLETGIADVEVSRPNPTAIIHDLHRGKDAGAVWKAFIDLTAGLILTMSLIGLILFFSLRFRLATSLKIMGSTLLAFASLYIFFTT